MFSEQRKIANAIRAKLQESRIARLATFDAQRGPHIVPVCFTYDGEFFYTAIDQKPERVAPERLIRLRNIRASPQVALLIDRYDEDWTRLWYILIHGNAKLIPLSRQRERASAIRKLRAKYPQYAGKMLAANAPIIRITPEQITFWGKF